MRVSSISALENFSEHFHLQPQVFSKNAILDKSSSLLFDGIVKFRSKIFLVSNSSTTVNYSELFTLTLFLPTT